MCRILSIHLNCKGLNIEMEFVFFAFLNYSGLCVSTLTCLCFRSIKYKSS